MFEFQLLFIYFI